MSTTLRLLFVLVASAGSVQCTVPCAGQERLPASVRSWADTSFSRNLADLIDLIEKGDLDAWQQFAGYVQTGLDGERSETYSMACAELARRDPTLFLRHHLDGDAKAVAVGKRAFGGVGSQGRHVMNWLHESRLALAETKTERHKIESYIASLQTVLESIDRRYR